ncbi:hypothetical protein ES703_123656 [subsurface metagenome]
MWWVDTIYAWVWDFAWQLREWGDSIWTWIPYYEWFRNRLYDAAEWLWKLLTPIAHFSDWVYDVGGKVENILSIVDIIALLKDWLDWAAWSWQWIDNAWEIITGWIDEWWSSTSLTVQTWISIATEGLADLLTAWDDFWTITWPEWTSKLDNLTSELHSFFTLTLPGLVSFDWLGTWWNDRLTEVNTLINDTIKIWLPFYDSLATLWSNVAEFIVNPLDWLEKRLADWFLGPEV